MNEELLEHEEQKKKELREAAPLGIGPGDLAAAIRYHRKKSRLTQQQLAELAGLGKAVIFDIEKGKRTSQLDTLLKILTVLNISIRFNSPLMGNFLKEQNAPSRNLRK
jgi:HTH-type transcriptional regulator/antitoxin HipB